MHLTKSNKCIILLTIILVLLISPKPAAVAMLKPEENVEVQCDYFYETITILNEPEMVKVSLLIYNLSSEDNLQHLTLTIASYSEYFDEDSIRTYDTESGENISVEPIGMRYKNDPGVYLHEFRLTFDPPLSDKIRTTEISYITNGSKWNEDKTEMILYVMAWSSKILPSGLSVISAEGEGEGFKINPVLNFTLVDFFDIYKTEQRYGVYIWPENLISYPYPDVPIHASYTPAYPSQWYVWDQYQRIEEMFQQTNQLLERANQLLERTNQLLEETRTALRIALFGILMTFSGIIITIKRKWLAKKWKKLARVLRK